MTEFHTNMPQAHSFQWQSISLAALVHLLLLGFLWAGVQWQNTETTAVEAEVWDMTTRQAAPAAVAEPVETQSEPQPEPEPVQSAQQEITEPETAAKVPDQAALDKIQEEAEIALAQEKRKKKLEQQAQAQREAQEKQEKQEKIKLAELKKAEEKKAEKLAEAKAEKLAKEKLAKAEAQAEEKAKKEAEKKLAEAKLKKVADQKQLAKEQSLRDKAFKENMQRLAGQVDGKTGSGANGGTGEAARSTGDNRGDVGYAGKIAAKVRSNTIFNVTDSSANNPTVEYKIELLPDGTLRGPIRKLKSSGVAGFDEAVEKAIEKSIPFPRNKFGEIPPSIVYVHRMKE